MEQKAPIAPEGAPAEPPKAPESGESPARAREPESPGGDKNPEPLHELACGNFRVHVRRAPLDPYNFRAKQRMSKAQRQQEMEAERNFEVALFIGENDKPEKPWRTTTGKAMGFLPVNDSRRLFAFCVVESPIFERVVLMMIMVNSMLLALEDHTDGFMPMPRETHWTKSSGAKVVDKIFLIAFAAESFLKIMSYGFIMAPNTYLRDGWNWLDFIVVVTGIIELVAGAAGVNLSFIRVCRVLRPLRSLTVLPDMKVIVNAVLASIPGLGNVATMGVFLMVLFGILGINLFSGMMFRRCRINEHPVLYDLTWADPSITVGALGSDLWPVINGPDGVMLHNEQFMAWETANIRLGRDELTAQLETITQCWSFPIDPDIGRLCGGSFQCNNPEEGISPLCKSHMKEEYEMGIPAGQNFWPFGAPDKGPNEQDQYWAPASMAIAPLEFNPKGRDGEHLLWCPDAVEGVASGDFNFMRTNFDRLDHAILLIFQCMTMEGWTDIMYVAQDAVSDAASSIYFLIVFMFCSLFLLNIALAVLWQVYSELQDAEKDRVAAELQDTEPVPGSGATIVPVDGDGGASGGFQPGDDGYQEPPWLNVGVVIAANKIANSDAFQSGVMMCILANVVVMMLQSYPPPSPAVLLTCNTANLIFTASFGVEFLVLHVAMGPHRYWSRMLTFFDGVIVLTSLYELSADGGSAVGALRGFRLLRVFKLAKKWTSFRVLLKSMIQTLVSMSYFNVLLLLVMFVFTLCGEAIFANRFRFHGDNGLAIDDSMFWCDSWSADGLTCEGRGPGNVFVAPVVHAGVYCPDPSTALDGSIIPDYTKTLVRWTDAEGGLTGALQYNPVRVPNDDCIPRANFDSFLWAFVSCFAVLSGENWNAVMYDGMNSVGPWTDGRPFIANYGAMYFVLLVMVGQLVILNLFLAMLMNNFDEAASETRAAEAAKLEANSPSRGAGSEGAAAEGAEPEDVDGAVVDSGDDFRGMALFFMDVHHPVRRMSIDLVSHTTFDNFILACIIVSSLAMVLDEPLGNPYSWSKVLVFYSNYFFTLIFFFEMIIKHLAYGVILGPTAYWRSAWNILDGLVVIVAVIDILPLGEGIGFLKTLRIMRALRPLRVISRNENLKLVVNTIFKSVPELCNLLIVGTLFFLIFGLFSVNATAGSLYMCQMADGGELGEHPFNVAPATCDPELGCANADAHEPGTLAPTLVQPMCIDVEPTSATHGYVWPRLDASVDCSGPAMATYDDWVSFIESNDGTGVAFAKPSSTARLEPWQRPTLDTPICKAACPADPSNDQIEHNKKNGCHGKLEMSVLLVERGQPGHIDARAGSCASLDEPAPLPDDHPWILQSRQSVMPCGATVSDAGSPAGGCYEMFCPNVDADGNPTDPDSDLANRCRSECEYDGEEQLYCMNLACQKGEPSSQSPECAACRQQCEAACMCKDYCEPFNKQAAVCVEQGGMWLNSLSQHFDTVWQAMLTLFEISTTEGWVDVMYMACDAVAPMMQMERNTNQVVQSLYWCLFIFFGQMFFWNLCIGVICDNFSRIKEENGGAIMMTPQQSAWVDGRKQLLKQKALFGVTDLLSLPPPRRSLYLFVQDSRFESFIMCCILSNTLVMSLKVFPALAVLSPATLVAINYLFAAVFTVEAGLKLTALRMAYFRDGWNWFDFTCVVATNLGIVVQLVFNVKLGPVAGSIRLFRVARLFRLLRFAKGLNQLFVCLILTIPKLMNVAMILMLLLFLFSVMGMNLFAKTQMQGFHDEAGNFHTFYRAFLTLVRSMTGEAWNEVMHSLARDAEAFGQVYQMPCVGEYVGMTPGGIWGDDSFPGPNGVGMSPKEVYERLNENCFIDYPVQCGNPVFASAFFVIFTCIIAFFILNLFVAVVLEGFDGSAIGDEEQICELALKVWRKYDTNLDFNLPVSKVHKFLSDVEAEFAGERGWGPVDQNTKRIIKYATAQVYDWLECKDSGVTFMDATLGSLMLLLSLVAIHEPGSTADETLGDAIRVAEFLPQQNLKQARLDKLRLTIDDLIVKIKELDSTLVPANERPESPTSASDDAAMPDGVSALNFRSHAAALKVQEIFRDRREARALAARTGEPGKPPRVGNFAAAVGQVAPSSDDPAAETAMPAAG